MSILVDAFEWNEIVEPRTTFYLSLENIVTDFFIFAFSVGHYISHLTSDIVILCPVILGVVCMVRNT